MSLLFILNKREFEIRETDLRNSHPGLSQRDPFGGSGISCPDFCVEILSLTQDDRKKVSKLIT